ncbi:arginine--tRNA ligase, cytoplasmic-like protein isoform X1, partial [Tanacetum coccineum]
ESCEVGGGSDGVGGGSKEEDKEEEESHFGHVQGDDLDRFQSSNTKVVSLVNLLDEAKTRCKVLLAGQAGMADEWTSEELEHAAEALGYGAVKYADLNNRLTNYTFSFDQMLNEKVFL